MFLYKFNIDGSPIQEIFYWNFVTVFDVNPVTSCGRFNCQKVFEEDQKTIEALGDDEQVMISL